MHKNIPPDEIIPSSHGPIASQGNSPGPPWADSESPSLELKSAGVCEKFFERDHLMEGFCCRV